MGSGLVGLHIAFLPLGISWSWEDESLQRQQGPKMSKHQKYRRKKRTSIPSNALHELLSLSLPSFASFPTIPSLTPPQPPWRGPASAAVPQPGQLSPQLPSGLSCTSFMVFVQMTPSQWDLLSPPFFKLAVFPTVPCITDPPLSCSASFFSLALITLQYATWFPVLCLLVFCLLWLKWERHNVRMWYNPNCQE